MNQPQQFLRIIISLSANSYKLFLKKKNQTGERRRRRWKYQHTYIPYKLIVIGFSSSPCTSMFDPTGERPLKGSPAFYLMACLCTLKIQVA